MIFATLLSAGCIYEEHVHVHEVDSGLSYDEEGLEDEEAHDEVQLAFEPSVVAPGETFIGYVTVAKGDFALVGVSDVTFYGDVSLESWDLRDHEIIVSLEVAQDAAGEIDLVLETDDGDAVWLEAAISVQGAGDAGEAGSDDGTTGDDGSGGDGSAGSGSEDDCE